MQDIIRTLSRDKRTYMTEGDVCVEFSFFEPHYGVAW